MIKPHVERCNSRFAMVSCGENKVKYPYYAVVDIAIGNTLHQGRRKHILEMWNTRYNYSRSRAYASS